MRGLILVLILFLPTQSYAWTENDTKRQLFFALVLAFDYRQTIYIATHEEFYETNPILGKYPSVQEVDIYFAATLAGHTIVSYLLPSKYRAYWQMFWIGAEFKQVAENYSIGIDVHF